MPKPPDRFYDYLDYCDKHGAINPGDYLEKIGATAPLEWTRLITDLRDTYKAGDLQRVITSNGQAAYIRK